MYVEKGWELVSMDKPILNYVGAESSTQFVAQPTAGLIHGWIGLGALQINQQWKSEAAWASMRITARLAIPNF